MRETWYYIVEEFRALGLRCVACGPEFWLALAAICGMVCVALVVGWVVFKDEEGDDE